MLHVLLKILHKVNLTLLVEGEAFVHFLHLRNCDRRYLIRFWDAKSYQ